MSFLPELSRLARAQFPSNSVHIFHPGCRRELLYFPAIPHPRRSTGSNTPEGVRDDGVDHRLVMDACHIITNHSTKARGCYLSTDRGGQKPATPYRDSDGLPQLAPGKYYYQPGPPSVRTIENYPIVTDPAAWRFPRKEDIPAHWRRPRSEDEQMNLRRKHGPCPPVDFDIEVALDDFDRGGCAVTKHIAASEIVRLVPLDYKDWFERNGLNQYNWGPEYHGEAEVPEKGTNDPANGLRLRVDVAELLEDDHFVFFPAAPGSCKFMTYLCDCSTDYVELLHRRLVTLPLRVADEFLYARFGHVVINNLCYPGSVLNKFPVPEGIKPSPPKFKVNQALTDQDN